MTWVAVGVAAVTVVTGAATAVSSADSARRAGHTQADAANAATQAQTTATQEGIGAQATATAPWRNIGAGALYKLADLLGIDPRTAFPGAGQTTGFTDASGNALPGSAIPGSNLIPAFPKPPAPGGGFTTDPGYQFRLGEGQRGIANSGAARGMQLSGASLKELDRFNQDYASNEFTNVYNRLSNTAGLGQTAAQGTGNAASQGMFNLGNEIGSNLIGAGNANAAGQIGGSNALIGGLSNTGNSLAQQYYLRNLFGTGGSSGGAGYLNMSNAQQVNADIQAGP